MILPMSTKQKTGGPAMAAIMIVDDSGFMRTILKQMVLEAGHQVAAEADNGLDAVETYSRVRPDVVFMNIVMPELYGIEALKRIIQLDPRAKVIICSAMGSSYNVLEAIKSGALDFIVKPFEQARIAESIKKALSRL
jgi:two-component system chemotaxis response regulator CheY